MSALELSRPERKSVSSLSTDSASECVSFHLTDLVEGLPADEVHKRALGARKILGRAQRALCFWLVEIEKRKLFKNFGCSSVFHYAETCLELSPATIYEFLRTGRELEKLPLIAKACAKGDIAPSKVREISRVATVETEEFWLKVGTSSSCRQVEKLVALTPKGGLPPAPDISKKDECAEKPGTLSAKKESEREEISQDRRVAPVAGDSADTGTSSGTEVYAPQPAERISPADNHSQSLLTAQGVGPSRYHCKLVVELESEQMELVQRAMEKARRETGRHERSALLEHILRAFLQGISSEEASSAPPYRVTLHSIPEANITWIEGAGGPRHVTPEKLEEALCDCEILDLRASGDIRVRKGHGNLPGKVTESPEESAKIIEEATAIPAGSTAISGNLAPKIRENCADIRCANACNSSDQHPQDFPTWGNAQMVEPARNETYGPHIRGRIPPSLRRKLLERDGCCSVPGCHNRVYIHLHHIKPVAKGGKNTAGNLCSTCWACHAAVHEGRLSVEGEAPNRLIWRNSKGEILKGSTG